MAKLAHLNEKEHQVVATPPQPQTTSPHLDNATSFTATESARTTAHVIGDLLRRVSRGFATTSSVIKRLVYIYMHKITKVWNEQRDDQQPPGAWPLSTHPDWMEPSSSTAQGDKLEGGEIAVSTKGGTQASIAKPQSWFRRKRNGFYGDTDQDASDTEGNDEEMNETGMMMMLGDCKVRAASDENCCEPELT